MRWDEPLFWVQFLWALPIRKSLSDLFTRTQSSERAENFPPFSTFHLFLFLVTSSCNNYFCFMRMEWGTWKKYTMFFLPIRCRRHFSNWISFYRRLFMKYFIFLLHFFFLFTSWIFFSSFFWFLILFFEWMNFMFFDGDLVPLLLLNGFYFEYNEMIMFSVIRKW